MRPSKYASAGILAIEDVEAETTVLATVGVVASVELVVRIGRGRSPETRFRPRVGDDSRLARCRSARQSERSNIDPEDSVLKAADIEPVFNVCVMVVIGAPPRIVVQRWSCIERIDPPSRAGRDTAARCENSR